VVFIHGVLNDHSVWACKAATWPTTAGTCWPSTCPATAAAAARPRPASRAADFIARCSTPRACSAALVGHSWGSLIALEAAARLGERVSHLVLVGTAFPMKVSPALLEALNEPEKALRMVNVFSRSTLAPPSALGPGTWVFGAGMALGGACCAATRGERVPPRLRGLRQLCRRRSGHGRAQLPGAVRAGRAGPDDAAQGRPGPDPGAQAAGKTVRSVSLEVGHNQMTEAPDGTLWAIRDFRRS
jgi:pimeloyl-ACP methyl ester carboxylesterase